MRNTATAILLASLALGGAAFAQDTTTPPADIPPEAAPATDNNVDSSIDAAPTTAPTMDAPATDVPAAPPAVTPDATAPAVADPAAPAAALTGVVPEGYSALEFSAVTADELKGVNVYDSTGSSVAEIGDLVLSADGSVTGVVVDVGGFLGIGQHSVSLAPEQVAFYRNADNDLRGYVNLTKEELKALPAYTAPAG